MTDPAPGLVAASLVVPGPVESCQPCYLVTFPRSLDGLPFMKVCIGGGVGAGRGAGAGAGAAAGLELLLPDDPLVLTISPFQFIDTCLLVPQNPPSLSDHLHRGRRPHLAGRWVALPGYSARLGWGWA